MTKRAQCNKCDNNIFTNYNGVWVHRNRIFRCYTQYEYKVADNYEDIKDLRAEPIEDTINKLKVFNNKDLLRLFND